MTEQLPWDGMKAGFSFNEDPDILFNADKAGIVVWPDGWKLNETDSSGARTVAVFEIDGIPNETDGLAVRLTLDMLAECGEGEVAALDLKPGDCLDLDGDPFADPDAPSSLEYELAVVEGIGRDGAAVVVYTDQVNFACPPDHKMKRLKVDFQVRKELTEYPI